MSRSNFSFPTLDIELPEDLSPEMYSLLSNLLTRDVDRRLGCMGRGTAVCCCQLPAFSDYPNKIIMKSFFLTNQVTFSSFM
ncbi:hypothetical protein ACTXT7_015569 [Hymenolepis weldensis]